MDLWENRQEPQSLQMHAGNRDYGRFEEIVVFVMAGASIMLQHFQIQSCPSFCISVLVNDITIFPVTQSSTCKPFSFPFFPFLL